MNLHRLMNVAPPMTPGLPWLNRQVVTETPAPTMIASWSWIPFAF